MRNDECVRWVGYPCGALPADKVTTIHRSSDGNIIVASTSGRKYNVHPFTTMCGGPINPAIYFKGGVYPVRWEITSFTSI